MSYSKLQTHAHACMATKVGPHELHNHALIMHICMHGLVTKGIQCINALSGVLFVLHVHIEAVLV